MPDNATMPPKIDVTTYVRPIGVQRNAGAINFAGTAFGVEKPGLVLTAAHVVQDAPPNRLHLETVHMTGAKRFRSPRSVAIHPSADIAVLTFHADDTIPYFNLGKPPDDTGEFHLGTEVLSYGYPRRVEAPSHVSLEPRLLTGHMQRVFRHERGNYSYLAYELSFPSVDGQSGSPVLLAESVTSSIAVVTDNFESTIQVDHYEEHDAQGRLETHTVNKVVAYGLGLALWPLADWIRSL